MNRKIYPLIYAVFSLLMFLFVSLQVQRLISRATFRPANIIIDTRQEQGSWNNNWGNFSQGGEEPPPMLDEVINQINALSPEYIRLDHIYDFYNVVSITQQTISYDFSLLDETVDDILAMGAKPFFSVSYMPAVFTKSSNVIDTPTDWNNWRDLVKATIEHYSGKNGKNLTDIYYEVWNEPELVQFGSWKLNETKDYRQLYFYAAEGAKLSRNVNNFFLGGPSIGSYYPRWIDDFAKYVVENKLRLDFYSWHRYHKNPKVYRLDAEKTRQRLRAYPTLSNIPLILTEWGIDSANNQNSSTNMAAAYSVWAVSLFTDYLDMAFNFEIKDGPPPNGGKWGLLNHERDDKPLFLKPRYYAFDAMRKLIGKRIPVQGEGTHVTALAGKTNKTITVVLSNYDWNGKNSEEVPVVFTGLVPGSYNLKYTYVLDSNSGNFEMVTTDGKLSKSFIMLANSILILELIPTGQLAQFVPGVSNQLSDKALILQNSTNPLFFATTPLSPEKTNKIIFDLKPFWVQFDSNTFIILEAPYLSSNYIHKLYLTKQKSAGGNFLVLDATSSIPERKIAIPIDTWKKDSWHHIEISWKFNQIELTIDGLSVSESVNLQITSGVNLISLYPIEAAVDNFIVLSGDEVIIRRHYNNQVNN